MKRSLVQAARITLGLFVLSAVPLHSPLPAMAASPDGHLYLATGGRNPVVQRYPLYGGLPSAQSDLTIPGAGAPIAVTADGSVAAMVGPKPEVGFFAAGQTVPARTLFITHTESCPPFVPSIVMDAAGYLYASYVDGGMNCFNEGIFIYGPRASGKAKPLQNILALFGNLALDAQGNLYDSPAIEPGYQTSVYVFGSPKTNPHALTTIVGVVPFGNHIVIDTQASRLWTYTVPGGAEYAVGAWGANSLVAYSLLGGGLPNGGIFTRTSDAAKKGEIGYRNGLLYATFGGPNGAGVNVFYSAPSGLTQPLATLPAPAGGISDMAVGP